MPALAPRQLRVLGSASETMSPDNQKPSLGDTFNQVCVVVCASVCMCPAQALP